MSSGVLWAALQAQKIRDQQLREKLRQAEEDRKVNNPEGDSK